MIKRAFDVFFSIFLIILLTPILIIVSILVKVTSSGPVIYFSHRVGKNNVIFKMPKFRTMKTETPPIATHLLTNPLNYLTPVGGFLRRSSLDELPQLWCVLKGDMSFVGPRPALFNQYDLIEIRTKCNVHKLLPGITGIAQIRGRDNLSIIEKAVFDEEYLIKQSFILDIKIILLTVIKTIRFQGVSH